MKLMAARHLLVHDCDEATNVMGWCTGAQDHPDRVASLRPLSRPDEFQPD
jgi:hypothetical protein